MNRLAAALVLAIAARASAATLGPGDEAPPLQITKWVKGEPFDQASAKGNKVVVVEFWATWCPPCITSIPHLTKLQKENAGKGVVVIGVTKPDQRNTLEAVEKFVAEKGETMDYRVAFDGDSKTFGSYMTAAGQGGIPTAFIVDKSGKLAWIGHPMAMDKPLEDVLAGNFDIEMAGIVGGLERKATEFFRAGKTDRALQMMEALAALDETGQWKTRLHVQKMSILLRAKEGEKAAAAGAKAVEELADPQALTTIGNLAMQDGVPGGADLAARAARKALEKDGANTAARLILLKALFKAGKADDGVAEARKLIDSAKDQPGILNDAAWSLLTEGDFPKPVLEVALKAAERCHELTKGENWMYLDTLACAKFKTGDAAKALELQRKAVELGEKAKVPEAALKDCRDRLEQYEKAAKKGSVEI